MKKEIADRLRRFEETCKKHGLRLTQQRLLIYRILAGNTNHPTAEDIYKKIHKRHPTISFDTVYRTLRTFEKYGIISRVHILDDKGRFDTNLEHHAHIVCTQCKRITDLPWEAFEKLKLPRGTKQWGEITTKYVELRGICSACLKKKR